MLKNLRTVNQWMKQKNDQDYPLLQDSFAKATDVGTALSQVYFFNSIWIPRPKTNAEHYGASEYTGDAHAFYVDEKGQFEWKYENIGMAPDSMSETYMTLYGYNMLSVPITDPDMLTLKIRSIFHLNIGKYKKWLDTMGYAYNPLWNVDGSDFFQYIDTHGNVTRTNTPILQSEQELKTVPYDNETYRATNKTINTYSGTQSTEEETHDNVTDAELNGPVHAITGGDYSHIEKRIRQGNQGITMTTQLIAAERELVKFNLIQEFFRDINKQLLVGTYDGF